VGVDRLLAGTQLCEYLGIGLMVLDRRLRIVLWNRWMTEHTGLQPDDVLGRPLAQVFPELRQRGRLNHFAAALAGEAQVLSARLHKYLVRLPAAYAGEHGEHMWQTARLLPLREGDDVTGVVVLIEDVTERHHRERELLELVQRVETSKEEIARSERRFRGVFETTSDLMAVLDGGGTIHIANPTAQKRLGGPGADLVGSNLLGLVGDPQGRELVREALAQVVATKEGSRSLEAWFNPPAGEEILLEVSLQPLPGQVGENAVLFQGHDLTEKRKMEAALRAAEEQFWLSQKADAVALLAGGVAHDFNNMLSIILGFTELTLQSLPEDDPNRPNLDEIKQAATRAGEITSQLLAFTGRRPGERQPLEIAPLVRTAAELVSRSLPEGVKLEEDVGDDVGLVLADRAQLEQVVVNLCLNAAAALGSKQEGIVRISVERCQVGDEEAGRQGVAPGPYFRLCVANNGESLDDEAIKRFFDPYYDPRLKGRGRNLGLAASHGIVKSHGGFSTVSSLDGAGYAVCAYLPVYEGAALPQEREAERSRGGTERILVVDDEPVLARLHKEVLASLGYRVSVALGPQEALRMVESEPDGFDLMVLDMSMPGMTGDVLAMNIRRLVGDVPVILCTGYSERITAGKLEDMQVNAYLTKPIRAKELARTVRMVLDQVSTKAGEAGIV